MYHISLKLFTKLEGLKTHQESKCKKKHRMKTQLPCVNEVPMPL